ncbi:unnamed protein product [Heterobilharzia americana]|nr:unnamed protein product [Heterobilharzia americana]
MKIDCGNGIELSCTDRRAYRDFELQNGMKVMVISAYGDDGDTLSAAALCIRVGSFSDPYEAQGLSHLLEYMLFHGDSPNSEVKCFHDYIHERNGYWDSKTSNEHTLFYFSIPNKYFDEALSLFALYFINPILKRDIMRKAIEKLDMGNKVSLITEPEKNNVDVYALLKKHLANLYSAHRMTLAVQSKDALNTLERIVREKFSNIPTNRSIKLDLTRYANSFDTPEFLKLYHVDSTRNKEQLRMVWAIPSVYSMYKSNPVAVFAYFLSDKHPYGLENYLKNNHLATEVKCEFSAMSDFDNSTICALITICIDLNGTRNDLLKITKLVYEYLRFLSNKAHEAYLNNKNLNESNNNNNISEVQQVMNSNVKSSFDSCVRDLLLTQKEAFLRRKTFGPQETVIWIANMLHYTLPQDVHSAYLVIKKPDFQVYSEFLDTLSKQQACLIHSSKINSLLNKNIRVEKWYNLQYTQEEISTKHIGCTDNSNVTVPFSLPLKINASAHDYTFESSENGIQTPVNLITEFKGTMYEGYGSLWYQQINNESTTEVYIYTQISSGMKLDSPLKACLSRLLQMSIKLRSLDSQNVSVKPGVKCSVKTNLNGPEFIVKGSYESIDVLYKQLLGNTTVDFSKEHFTQCKKHLTEELLSQLSNPDLCADNLNSSLWDPNDYATKCLLQSLSCISIADLMAFQSKYFYQLEIVMYIVGDVTDNLAKELFTFTVEFFKCHPKPDGMKTIKHISLRPGVYCHSVTSVSMPEKVYQLIHYERIENASSTDEIYCRIIKELLKTHAQQYFQNYESINGQVSLDFYKLGSCSLNQIMGTRLSLISQSFKYDTDYLINCVNIFWQQIAVRVIACIDHKNLELIYDAINLEDVVDTSNVENLSQYYWNKIKSNQNGIKGESETFTGRNEKINKKEVNRDKLLEYFSTHYLNPNRQISIFIDFSNSELNDYDESMNINKTNIANFNANLNSYLKDEDLTNIPQGYAEQLINKIDESNLKQVTRKIKHIESFRLRNKNL